MQFSIDLKQGELSHLVLICYLTQSNSTGALFEGLAALAHLGDPATRQICELSCLVTSHQRMARTLSLMHWYRVPLPEHVASCS